MCMLRTAFYELKMPVIKYIIYNHVLEILFSSGPETITAENIASSLDQQTQKRVGTF
ncbi:hypothetical protein BD408DRAFT_266973 [Parasitella parasitica]|nr:hypothetical protein BD408DRAFT_266973 [Parasitella parasitica]